MMFLTLLTPIVFYCIRDLRHAAREGRWAYFLLYLAMMTGATVLWLLLWRNVPLTSPNKYIMDIINMFVPPQ